MLPGTRVRVSPGRSMGEQLRGFGLRVDDEAGKKVDFNYFD